MVTVARIVAVQGLKGEVRLQLETDFPERFIPPLTVTLSDSNRSEPSVLTNFRHHKTGAVASFEGIATREAAERVVGWQVQVDDDERWPLSGDAHYVDEVIGLEAFDTEGRSLGPVTGVARSPAHDLYEIADGRHLVPATKAWVAFDFPARRLMVLRSLEEVEDAH